MITLDFWGSWVSAYAQQLSESPQKNIKSVIYKMMSLISQMDNALFSKESRKFGHRRKKKGGLTY